MSKKGYVNDENWLEIALIVARAIRNLPVVKDHPTWWVRLHVDGLSSHHKVYQANLIFAAHRIWIIVEIPHSSHLNQVRVLCACYVLISTLLLLIQFFIQSFDADPARASKGALRDFLPEVRAACGKWLLS
jgi:hypothetical protein